MSVEYRDYYKILGVSKSAAQDEIKSAFRKLARKYHPDTAKDKKAAEEKFKEINEAYEVLSDPEKRRKYDTLGANWNQQAGPPPSGQGFPQDGGWGYSQGEPEGNFEFGGTGFSDFFERIFGSRGNAYGFDGGRRAGGHQYQSSGPMKGHDIEADISVALEEALHGAARKISFRRSESEQPKTYTVKIPKGVHEGQKIRLTGQGHPGVRGGKPGDLFLTVRLQKHPDFQVEGAHIYRDVHVPVTTAVLGGEVEVSTLDGRVRLRIPEGTQNGQKFRLPNKGLPKTGTTRGDLFAVIDVTLPKTLTEKERAAWQEIANL